jgi:hypothetical protein
MSYFLASRWPGEKSGLMDPAKEFLDPCKSVDGVMDGSLRELATESTGTVLTIV